MSTTSANSGKPQRFRFPKITENRLRLIIVISTLGVAAYAIHRQAFDPEVWAFLALVINFLWQNRDKDSE